MTTPKVIVIPANPQAFAPIVKRQLRVAAYCRVSTENEEQINSYENQMKYYTDKIMTNPEWTMAGIFADEGISGTSARKRPEFLRMIRHCRQKKIDLILTKSISRFARNTVDCLTYVRILREHGVAIIFEEQNINTLESDSEMLITLLGAFAQSESESISANIRWGIRQAMREGKANIKYKHLYAYEKGEDGKPKIIPEQAEVVKSIFHRYLAGASLRQIKEWLETEGIRNVLGESEWNIIAIRTILTNEKYCGDVLLQKTFILDCISKKVVKNTGQLAPVFFCSIYLSEKEDDGVTYLEILSWARKGITMERARLHEILDEAIQAQNHKLTTLIALYHNLAEQDRVITNFSVYVEDIQEDLSPRLSYEFLPSLKPTIVSLYNSGWGETGAIQIELSSISCFEEQNVVDLSIKEDAQTSWIFDTLKPGEERNCKLLSKDDFVVKRSGDFNNASFRITYILTAPESDYYTTLECVVVVFPNRIEVMIPGIGSGDEINYVLWVDTSSPSWSNTYRIYQRIPGKQTVRLPIFIMPAKSCTMTVCVEFKTADGETIRATPLQQAHFIVPYYKAHPVKYINGKFLKWNAIDGMTKIYFPFTNISKIIPEWEITP